LILKLKDPNAARGTIFGSPKSLKVTSSQNKLFSSYCEDLFNNLKNLFPL